MKNMFQRISIFIVAVFLVSLIPNGIFVKGIPVDIGTNLGFENGLTGWTHSTDATSSNQKEIAIVSEPITWRVDSYGNSMAVLSPPIGYNPEQLSGIDQMTNIMGFSNDSKDYLQEMFGQNQITSYSFIYQDVEMEAGDKLSFSWNYVSTDYVPFNDGSIASMTYVGNSNVYPKINGVFTQVSILGATVPGTGNYSTGDYGSTGWQSITMEATVPGLYRIGFATFNLNDYDMSPVLFVDNAAGTTLNNGVPFGPISPDDNPPPSFKVSTLTYSSKTFIESPDDDGSIESKITVSIDNDTFTGDIGEVFEPVTFSNVPAGLAAKAVKTGDKTIEISFEGNALQHAVSDTVSNVTMAFSDDAFTIYGVNETNNTVTSDLNIQFKSFGSVHFATDGGSTINPLKVEKGTQVTKPTDPTKAGYSFSGWYTDTLKTTPYNFSSMFNVDSMTLYAKWTPNADTDYAVLHYQEKVDGTGYDLFETEDLEGTTGGSVHAGAKTYTGFVFDEENPESVLTGTIEGDGSLVLKLYYDRVHYDYVFKNWNDEVIAEGNIPYGADVPVPGNPVRSGYTFTGWSQEIPEVMPAEPLTFKAVFSINSYTLTFNSNGGSSVNSITKNYGELVGTVEETTKEGYTFKGWSPTIPQYVPASNSTYEAQWEINRYRVSFEENGGTAVTDLLLDYNTFIEIVPVTTKAGYTFEGWYTEAALENKWDFEKDTIPAEHITLHAKWSANTNTKYVVNHYKEKLDGTYELEDQEEFTGITDTEITAPVKIYIGFSVDRTHEDEVATGIIDGSGTLELSLYYQRDSFKVVFKDWDGTVLKEVTLKYESGAKAPTGMTREGYTFTHWDEDFTKITEDLEVKAIYTINQYDVSFEENGGSEVLNLRQDFNTLIESNTATSRIGYTFEGWFTGAALETEWDFAVDKVPAQNITLYANWSANTDTAYKVKHYKEALDGIYVEFEEDSVTGTTDTEVTAVSKIYEGFTYLEDHEDEISSGNISGDGTLVLALYYSRNDYTAAFDSKGGTEVASLDVLYENLIEEPAAPTKAGYDFGGWYVEEALETAWDFEENKMPAEDVALYAKWTARADTVYKVKHYKEALDGAYVEFEEDSLTGTTDTEATAVSKIYEGFTYLKDHEDEISSGNIRGDGSLVLELYYDRNEYRIIFRGFDGVVLVDDMMKYGESIELPEDPEKAGYIFKGWMKEVPETVPAKDESFESLWEITAAEEVRQKIEALPSLDEVGKEDGALLMEIKKLMDQLTEEELKYLKPEDIEKFQKSSTVYVEMSFTDEKTKVRVNAAENTYFDPNLKLVVEEVKLGDLKEEAEKNLLSIRSGKEMVSVFSISLLLDNVKVQPNGKISIYLPLTEEMKEKFMNFEVIYVADDGKITVMPSKVEGEYLVFETDHLSYYSIIGTKIKSLPSLGEAKMPIGFGFLLLGTGLVLYLPRRKRKTAI
jgi:uncharacterized repeat protein (TIGR02543 family)